MTACESSVWSSDSSVVCQIAKGSQPYSHVAVTAGDILGTGKYAVSVDIVRKLCFAIKSDDFDAHVGLGIWARHGIAKHAIET